jgi:SAM-dependent methyltransferase
MSVHLDWPVRAAYDALAPYYDAFTAHHRLDEWTESIAALATQHGLRGRRLLDLACGTGKSLAPFAARGWDVTGCDVSPAMLAIAADRLPAGVPLVERDVRDLEAIGAFDLITALGDLPNYLTTQADLVAAFAGAERNLAPDALFAFDANTVLSYRTFFAATEVLEIDGLLLLWRGGASAEFASGDAAPGVLDAFAGPGPDCRRATSRHLQRHHTRATIEDALGQAGLRVVLAAGQHLDGRLDAHVDEHVHTKTLYLATPSRR